jgi:hypothetical protein
VLRTKLDAGRPVTRREANPAVPRAGFCRGNNHVTHPPRRRPESSVAHSRKAESSLLSCDAAII